MSSSSLELDSAPPLLPENMSGKHGKTAWELNSPIGHFPERRAERSGALLGYISRLVPSVAAKRRSSRYAYHAAATDEDLDEARRPFSTPDHYRRRSSRWLRYLRKTMYSLPLCILVLFGLLHILLALFGGKHLFWDFVNPDAADPNWEDFANARKAQFSYPTDVTRDVTPIPCHSHNDYWRTLPFWDAIHAGCTSVEADVWLFDGEDDLYVGHDTLSLTRERTFSKLYVDPIREVLDRMNQETEFGSATINGVFDEVPEQTLVLLVDFKTDGHALYPRVLERLEPLREKNYLSSWDGDKFTSRAVTVVGTGNTPFDLINSNKTYRDLFFDAPLDKMWEAPSSPAPSVHLRGPDPAQGTTGTGGIVSADDFNTTNSYYASVSFFASIGYPFTGLITDEQLDLIRGQIRGAQRRGLKVRYWEAPFWPTSLRNRVWELLVREGVDVLNVDDLKGATTLDWRRPVGHAWIDAR